MLTQAWKDLDTKLNNADYEHFAQQQGHKLIVESSRGNNYLLMINLERFFEDANNEPARVLTNIFCMKN